MRGELATDAADLPGHVAGAGRGSGGVFPVRALARAAPEGGAGGGGGGGGGDDDPGGMDWSPEGVSFARDNVPYARITWVPEDPNVPIDPERPMFMLLNLAVGGTIGAPPPEAAFPVDLVVDYVRVWS